MTEHAREWLPLSTAQSWTGLTAGQLRDMVEDGALRSTYIKRFLHVSAEDIDALIDTIPVGDIQPTPRVNKIARLARPA